MMLQVLLTSYEILQKDIGHLAKFDWAFCIVDEAHRSVNKTNHYGLRNTRVYFLPKQGVRKVYHISIGIGT